MLSEQKSRRRPRDVYGTAHSRLRAVHSARALFMSHYNMSKVNSSRGVLPMSTGQSSPQRKEVRVRCEESIAVIRARGATALEQVDMDRPLRVPCFSRCGLTVACELSPPPSRQAPSRVRRGDASLSQPAPPPQNHHAHAASERACKQPALYPQIEQNSMTTKTGSLS